MIDYSNSYNAVMDKFIHNDIAVYCGTLSESQEFLKIAGNYVRTKHMIATDQTYYEIFECLSENLLIKHSKNGQGIKIDISHYKIVNFSDFKNQFKAFEELYKSKKDFVNIMRAEEYDYQKLVSYCKKRGIKPTDMTIRELKQFVIK